MFVFIFWCCSVSLVYFNSSDFKILVQWILPLFTYFVLRRAIKDRQQYVKLIEMMLGALIVISISNAIYLALGNGFALELYYTGESRWRGLYQGVHTMGHNMGLAIMLMVLYYTLSKSRKSGLRVKFGVVKKIIFCIAFAACLYGLYKSQVRTVYIGLVVFFGCWLYYYSKKLMAVVAIGAVFLGLLLAPYLATVFYEFIDIYNGDRDVAEAGSGRPTIWMHNLNIFSDSTMDQKVAGLGVGNYARAVTKGGGIDVSYEKLVWNSHNDYLQVLMETGVVGFFLVIYLYYLLYKRIRRLNGQEQSFYVAFFWAVVCMNLSSNSYISRFGLAQSFFMILVYIELSPPKIKGRVRHEN